MYFIRLNHVYLMFKVMFLLIPVNVIYTKEVNFR